MEHATHSLLLLFIVYSAAQIGARVAQKLSFPSVVGEILAGVLIGPHALSLIVINEPLRLLSELGAVLLLFSVGLETSLDQLKSVGRSAVSVGTLGVIVPFLMGAWWAHYAGYPTNKAMFIGTAFVATSAGITAKVLQELGVISRIESRIILAAAVVDDILAMLLLGVVTSLAATGTIELWGLAFVALQAVGFVLLTGLVGTRVMKRISGLELPINQQSVLALALILCLGLAAAAGYVGLAAIIGAFLAGMILSESKGRKALESEIHPILTFLVPFFFITTGAQVDLHSLFDAHVLWTICLVTMLAFLSKFIGAGLASLPLGRRSAALIGVGMVPRGEVGIIIAGLGLSGGIISAQLYSIIIAMSLLTSIVAPPLLKHLLLKAKPDTPEQAS